MRINVRLFLPDALCVRTATGLFVTHSYLLCVIAWGRAIGQVLTRSSVQRPAEQLVSFYIWWCWSAALSKREEKTLVSLSRMTMNYTKFHDANDVFSDISKINHINFFRCTYGKHENVVKVVKSLHSFNWLLVPQKSFAWFEDQTWYIS